MTRTSVNPKTLTEDATGRTPPVSAPAAGATGSTDVYAGAAGEAGDVPAADIAAYMADMLHELRAMARQSGFDTLGRVLEIAESEAKLRVGDRG